MSKYFWKRKFKCGSALALTLFFLTLLWFTILSFTSSSIRTLRLSNQAVGSERALWAAESGLRLTVAALAKDASYRPKDVEVKMMQVAATYKVEVFIKSKAPVKIPDDCLYVVATGRDLGSKASRQSAAVLLLRGAPANNLLGFSVFADSLTLSGNSTIDSFDSSVGSYPRGKEANVATNSTKAGSVVLLGGSRILGSMQVGVGGVVGEAAPARPTINSPQVIWKDWSCYSSGEELAMTTPLEYPPVVAPKPGVDPIDVNWKGIDLAPGSYGRLKAGGGGEVRLEGGTYVFSSIALGGGSKLSFVGKPDKPVKIYITESLDLSGGTLSNTTLRPRDMTFMLAKGVKAIMNGGAQAYAVVYGPEADFVLNGGTDFFGAVVGRSVQLQAGANIHYDIDLLKNPPAIDSHPSDGGEGPGGATVISWQRI